jgi:hypothetical protein
MDDGAKRTGDLESLEEIKRRLQSRDPDVLRAAEEADRTLIRGQLALPPLERLRAGIAFSHGLARFRRADDARG